MRVGRAVGYSLLALVDATVATIVLTVGAGSTLLLSTVRLPSAAVTGEVAVTATLVIAALTFVLTLLGSMRSHYRGGPPFTFIRLSKQAVRSLWYWDSWTMWRRRRR